MEKNKVYAFLIILILSAVYPFPSMAHDPKAKAFLLERGKNYEIWKNPDGSYTWRSARPWVWNGSAYAPYIIKEKQECITVKTALIATRLYKNGLEIYDPNFTRLAVKRERWLVFKWDKLGFWSLICESSALNFYGVKVERGKETLNVTATWLSIYGNLTVTYHYQPELKHFITWTPLYPGVYAIVQVWNDIGYSRMRLHNSTVTSRLKNLILEWHEGLSIRLFNASDSYGILEDQTSAKGFLHKVLLADSGIDYHGINILNGIAWIFYNETLSVLDINESLRLDPTTLTVSPPNDDAYVCSSYASTNYGSSTDLRVRQFDSGSLYRSFLKFDISSIPSDAIITDAKLKLYVNYRSANDNWELHAVSDDSWDEDSITWNNQPSYGSLLDSIYVNANGWFSWDCTDYIESEVDAGASVTSFMLKLDGEEGTVSSGGNADSKEGDNDPVLEVTYVLDQPPSIGEIQAPLTRLCKQILLLECNN